MTPLEVILIGALIIFSACLVVGGVYAVRDTIKRKKELKYAGMLMQLPPEERAQKINDGYFNEPQLSEKEVIEYGRKQSDHSRALAKLRDVESRNRGTEEGNKLLPEPRKNEIGGSVQDGLYSPIGESLGSPDGDKQEARNISAETIEF